MALSAQTLFHFTKFKNLKSIIANKAFKPSYSFEIFMNDEDKIFAYPMVCFCDIPLSRINNQANQYNSNGIGLNRTWGSINGLNPVFYLQPGSIP